MGGDAADEDILQVAEQVGCLLARRGAVLVCGGRGGVMEAACRGARVEGGTTLGILPGGDRREANPYLEVAIPTGMGEGRNLLVVRASDVLIALGGEFGTLSEIAFALKLGKPVVGVRTWELSKEGAPSDAIVPAARAEEAVDAAFRLLSP